MTVFQEYGDFTASAEVTAYLLTYDNEEVIIDNIGGSYCGYSVKNNYLFTGYFKGGYSNIWAYALKDDNSIEKVYSLWDNKMEAPPFTFTINEEEVTEKKYVEFIDSLEAKDTGEYEPKKFSPENIKTYFDIDWISQN